MKELHDSSCRMINKKLRARRWQVGRQEPDFKVRFKCPRERGFAWTSANPKMGRAETGERLGCLNVIIASLQNVQDVGLSGESIVGTVKNIPSVFLEDGDEVVNVSVTMARWGSALGSVMILTY